VTATDPRDCIRPQTLARLAEGTLPRSELMAMLAHVDDCADCTSALEMANEVIGMERKSSGARTLRGRWGLTLAAAATVMLFATLAVWAPFSPFRERDDMSRLVKLVPESERLVEPRLTGGFRWAEYRGARRDSDPALDAGHLKLMGAAGEAMERAQREASASTQHTAGVAMLLVDRADDAVRSLQTATQRAPQDPAAWSDLAAAQYAAAVRYRRSSVYPQALASADRALRLDAGHAEALFNRALILQRMGLREEARAAWQRYLAIDPSSAWAAEAQRYLKEIPAVDQESEFRRELPQLETAAVGGDGARVAQLVGKYPQQARTWSEGVHLGAWAEAEQRGDRAEADRTLAAARMTGAALRARGETLLADAVAAIDASRGAARAALVAAHADYKRGRMLYARQKPAEAGVVLTAAARGFAAGGSPMALAASYFAANTLYDGQQIAEAKRRLSEVRTGSRAHPGYAALTAQVEWQLAMCENTTASWANALPLLRDAEATFTAAGETRNAGSIAAMLPAPLMAMGRGDEAWDAYIRSFELLGATGNRERLLVALANATGMELRVRRLDAALALVRLETSMGSSGGNDLILTDALMRQAVISNELGDGASARRLLSDAAAATNRIPDAGLRAWATANVELGTGAERLASEPLRAREHLTRAIESYVAGQHELLLPESYLLRARAALRLGDREGAARDFEAGIEAIERHAIHFAGSVVGTGVLDAGRTLYEEAVRLQLDRGENDTAFMLAERARAQLTPNAAAIPKMGAMQQRLEGSGAAVLELMALPDEVAAFCITGRNVQTTRTRITRARLDELIAKNDARELFDVLVRPSLGSLQDARTLIVVAGPPLRNVPFSMLTDRTTDRPLIERMAVVSAPSAASLEGGPASATPRSLLAVVLPSGEETATLPDSDREIASLRGLYGQATVLTAEQASFGAFAKAAPRATVLHISGHTARQPGQDESALLFANGEHVSWQTVAGTPVARDSVVVLAACETLRAPSSSQERSLSLGEAFLAAGARAVFGTLTPIADRDALALFVALHRQLAAGVRADEALRRVQLDSLARGDNRAWVSVVLISNRIPPAL
jgi:tetratricopeptide (TPR) repeat protein